jgi:hypothetical protein
MSGAKDFVVHIVEFVRTWKSLDEAHALSPAALIMAPLSI